MARDLRLLPRRQRAISAAQEIGTLRLEPRQLARNVDVVAGGGFAQLGNARFQLGDRLLELELRNHRRRANRPDRRPQGDDAG
jgi:hypothetical protein